MTTTREAIEALIDATEAKSPVGTEHDRAHPELAASVLIPTRDLRATLEGTTDSEPAQVDHGHWCTGCLTFETDADFTGAFPDESRCLSCGCDAEDHYRARVVLA